MSTYVRKINIILSIVVIGQLIIWFQPAKAEETITLRYPFYGNQHWVTAWFDHSNPGYRNLRDPEGFAYRDGREAYHHTGLGLCPSNEPEKCYNGHTGTDYGLGYQPILAAAAGAVGYAGWASSNHETDLGLMIRLNHSHSYQTIYGHLSAIIYQTGEQIRISQRWQTYPQIGTSGNSGNSTGPHLHFEVKHHGKVTDPYGWQGPTGQDPWENHDNGTSSSNLWASNAVQPHPPEDGPLIIDDGDRWFYTTCYVEKCNWSNGPKGTDAHNNDFVWVDSSDVDTHYAIWQPYVPIRTQYELQVFIPNWDRNNLTHAARYTIYKNNRLVRVVRVDQHESAGKWISLGRLEFKAGLSSYLHISDNTSGVYELDENNGYTTIPYKEGSSRKVLVDAMRAYAN